MNTEKYDTCKKCGNPGVQLCISRALVFDPDQDDRQGNPSEYDGAVIYTDISVGAHICMECEAVEDVWIETPYQGDDEKILNWFQEQIRQRPALYLVRAVMQRVNLGEDLREVVKELMRGNHDQTT